MSTLAGPHPEANNTPAQPVQIPEPPAASTEPDAYAYELSYADMLRAPDAPAG